MSELNIPGVSNLGIVRRRHDLHPVLLALSRPAFRYSRERDAYVLRLVGERRGPVLRVRITRGVVLRDEIKDRRMKRRFR